MRIPNPRIYSSWTPAAAVMLLCCVTAIGQSAPSNQARYDQGQSRAEFEAEQRVSLSADKIIEILRDEPGLMLQVKKMLVRKAFEQGRIVDPSELTDEALFRMVRDDENIRILATHEIEDRSYIKAKPTREEIARENEMAMRGLPTPMDASVGASSSPKPNGANQEEAYWAAMQQRQLQQLQKATPPASAPASPYPVTPQLPILPQNPSRQIEMTSAQDQDFYDGLDVPGMGRLSADQLSGLLSASSGGSLQSQAGLGSQSSMGGGNAALAAAALSGGGSGLGNGLSNGIGNGMAGGFGGGGDVSSNGLDLQSLNHLSPQSGSTNLYDPALQFNQLSLLQEQRRRSAPLNDFGLDQTRIAHRPNPYANVPSLYDLNAQVGKRPPVLDRFGMDIFRNVGGTLNNLPMDLPVGPDYVLGPGDGLMIELWGGVSQRLRRIVDGQGKIALPEIGSLQVAGRSLGDVQHLVQTALRSQFRDVEADVSLSKLRTVRVYVVGDVAYPGAYDISSLSTPMNALYAAGGPTSRGSLRHLRQYRGKQLVQEIDAYDLLLHGVHNEMAHLQSGDSILVPPIGPEVTVQGMVRRPAIYELADETSLSDILELAGGVLPTGTLRHVDVDRLVAHEKRSMLRLDIPETDDQQAVNLALNNFQIQDGDTVNISPILPYSEKTVYLDGHVFHPGKYPYRDGMKVSDLVKSYGDVLPEPSQRHAEIIRLQPPDFTPEVLTFNLSAAMEGKDQDLVLKPFDTVRIFGRFDFEDPPVITVNGEVRDPGDHITNGATRLRDAVYLAGGVTPDAELSDVQVFRKQDDGKLKVLSVNLGSVLAGDASSNLLLQPKDRVFVHRSQSKVDPPTVQVQGEVARPGKYPMGEDMTVGDLIRLGGGLKRGADDEQADLARYLSSDGKAPGEHQQIDIAKAMSGSTESDVQLHDGDVLTIRQQPGFADLGAVITVKGEVVHPGTYGIREGERLSSVLARAGGLRSDAYAYGAILERAQVRELEEKTRADLIRHIQAEGNSLKLVPENDPEQKAAKEASLAQWQATLDKLQNTPPSGRLVVHISTTSKKWANTTSDPEVRAGDLFVVPKTPNFVMVEGSVYNPTAVSYKAGRNAGWYLEQAGGPTNVAAKKSIFLVRADGSVVGGKGGLFNGGSLAAAVRPGDMLVVPEKAYSGTTRWKNTLEAAQLAYAVGIAIQVAKGF